MSEREKNRRSFLKQSAATVGGLLAWTTPGAARELGAPRREYGERSPFEKSTRYFRPSATPASGASYTPLQDLYGVITPSALHYEVHHSGVPEIRPEQQEVLVHGLVERP